MRLRRVSASRRCRVSAIGIYISRKYTPLEIRTFIDHFVEYLSANAGE
jgi:hypothetical protein